MLSVMRSGFFALSVTGVLTMVGIAACRASGSAPQNKASASQGSTLTSAPAGVSHAASAPYPRSNGGTDHLQAFATNGAKILDSKTGDLRGNGAPDALLVLDTAVKGNEKLGEGPSRTVLLLTRNAAGQLQVAA